MSDIQEVVEEEIAEVEKREALVDPYVFVFGIREYAVDPREIKIDESGLVKEFTQQASKYAYIAVLASLAENDVKRAKISLKHEEAAANVRARSDLTLEGGKVTEKAVEARAIIDDGVKEIQKSLLDAEATHGLLKALEASYRMRADMMVSLGTRMRMEMEQTGMNMKGSTEELMKQVVEKHKSKS